MGAWHLEVFKMVVYMAFPVATFHYFNQPKYYEDYVNNLKREIFPPESEAHNQQLREAIHQIRQQKELRNLQKAAEKQ